MICLRSKQSYYGDAIQPTLTAQATSYLHHQLVDLLRVFRQQQFGHAKLATSSSLLLQANHGDLSSVNKKQHRQEFFFWRACWFNLSVNW